MSNKKTDLVIIRNEKTGHEIPIQRKSWFSRNGQSYPGYRLLDNPSDSSDWVEVTPPEPKIETVDPLTVIPEIKDEPEIGEIQSGVIDDQPKPKRRRKSRKKTSGENSDPDEKNI